jgi:small subunit ribosomal protein S17
MSNKADKTIVVSVQTRKTHPLYKKQYTISRRFMAHDEKNEAGVGDKVSIIETRPLSARKRHTLAKIINRPAIREEQSVEAVAPEPEAIAPKKTVAKKMPKSREAKE